MLDEWQSDTELAVRMLLRLKQNVQKAIACHEKAGELSQPLQLARSCWLHLPLQGSPYRAEARQATGAFGIDPWKQPNFSELGVWISSMLNVSQTVKLPENKYTNK